jgi:hypothetical protein
MQDLAYFEVLMRDWFLQWNLTYAAIVLGFVALGLLTVLGIVGVSWIASFLRSSSRRRRYPKLRVAEPKQTHDDYESVA